MQVLAIDTTGETLSVALLEGGETRAEVFINIGANHSLHLLPAIKHIYDITGETIEATDLFACTMGPGTFTGSRIGAATIKGLAMASWDYQHWKRLPQISAHLTLMSALCWMPRGDRFILLFMQSRQMPFLK